MMDVGTGGTQGISAQGCYDMCIVFGTIVSSTGETMSMGRCC